MSAPVCDICDHYEWEHLDLHCYGSWSCPCTSYVNRSCTQRFFDWVRSWWR